MEGYYYFDPPCEHRETGKLYECIRRGVEVWSVFLRDWIGFASIERNKRAAAI